MAKLWASAFTRPGDPNYGVKIAEIPVTVASGTAGFSGVFPAQMSIPKNYSRLAEILYTDGVVPANGVWSTIKLFSEGTADPIYEWLPSPLIPATSKQDPTVDISGSSIDSIIGFARVEPWDWNGLANFVSTFPDWIYGGRNLLGNPGFEDSACRPEVNEIRLDPTVSGGTFTLSNSNGTTDPIAWNAAASTVENEIEDPGTGPVLDDVLVLGSGTADDPYVITFITPCFFESGLVFNGAALTPAPGISVLNRAEFGALIPSPWTKSQTISDGTPVVHGEYDSFRVTTAEAHTGTFSLLIDPATIGRRFAGAQQVLNVKAGGRYQASVWVKTNSASQEYRFVIRGIDEDILLDINGNPALLQQTLASGVWTLFSIPDVDVGDNTRIILRIANINVSGNPAIFYVDDGEFNEGLPATTVGQMYVDLYDDATINHAGRVVWEDEATPGTMYFSNDFDGTNDSAGVPWDRSDVALTFRPRMTHIQVLEEFVREGGYEWRVVPDATPGFYLLQLYNPGSLGGVVPAGIQGGSTDVSHNARYFAPNASNIVLQGAGHQSARASNAGLLSAFGRIEGSELDVNVSSLTSAAAGAAEAVGAQVRGAESLVYELADPAQEPLVLYRPGDEIVVEDPPVISGTRRVSQIEFTFTKLGTKYVIYLGSESLVGQTAVNHQVGVLLRRFQRADEPFQTAAVEFGGGGGAPTVVVAAVDSTGMSQGKADFICNGVADQGIINQALAILGNTGGSAVGQGGRLILCEGNFVCTAVLDIPCNVHVLGMAKDATHVQFNYTTAAGVGFDVTNQNTQLSDLSVQINTTHGTPAGLIAVHMGDEGTRVQNVQISSEDIGVQIGPGQTCPPPS